MSRHTRASSGTDFVAEFQIFSIFMCSYSCAKKFRIPIIFDQGIDEYSFLKLSVSTFEISPICIRNMDTELR